ncbi:hypothetical protein [Marinivivus vitaminiproducens]|uniref:hypothetical protein n=1 Tax=Marinivivus vitaminiproducens TaxID=3035935 RepID=UPI00279C8E7D|nr:hypothetical protein P4R82_17360 [Geminicoccaceae bacterium SCSIO 64248]
MITLYLNRHEQDDRRRELIFGGDFFLHTDLASSKALCQHAKDMVLEAFDGLDPERAQFELELPDFIKRVGPLKSGFTNSAKTKDLCKALVEELGCDPDQTYYDLPRLRVVPSDNYLSSGVSYAYKAHRDTWYAHPTQLVNYWIPVFPVVGQNTMSMFVGYFDKPVQNASNQFDYDDWVANQRFSASSHVKKDERPHPVPQAPIDTHSEIRIAGGMGDVMMFSTCHLHATAPNNSGVTRFSVDLRTINLRDVKSGVGPANVDSYATGTTLGDFLRGSDHAPLDVSEVPDAARKKAPALA